jgi:hypothetical protein
MESPIDLDALDDYLMSDHAPDDSMGLSDPWLLDGCRGGAGVDAPERMAAGDLGWWGTSVPD